MRKAFRSGGLNTIVILVSAYVVLSAAATFTFNRCCAAPELLIEDRQALWRLSPGFQGVPTFFGAAENIRPVRIDERGFRAQQIDSRDLESPRARILAVGDSFTFGWDVAEHETYPAQLQNLLEQGSPGAFEVINAGMPGCSSFQAKQLLRRWMPRWQPKIIILLVGRNDGRQTSISDESVQAALQWKIPGSEYVFPFMFLHYRSVQSVAGWLDTRTGPRASAKEFWHNLNEIIDQATAHDAAVVLMQHWTQNGAYDLRRLASERKVPYLALPSLLRPEAAGREDLFIKTHFHPTPAGYHIIATALVDVIAQLPQAGQ